MIRCAKILEIPEILGLTKACAKQMEKRGIFQWNEEYPSREAFENAIDFDSSEDQFSKNVSETKGNDDMIDKFG